MSALLAMLALTWTGLWFTPDQEGHRLYQDGDYLGAAEVFHDPLWQGAAFFRAGDFKKALAAFSRRQTPEACFNKGNALVMLGDYDLAAEAYSQALEERPNWKEAEENRLLALTRAKRKSSEGGDLGDQQEEADEIVFDRTKDDSGGQETEVAGDQVLSEAQMQALWLRKVTTKSADFLKAKFSYQYQSNQTEGTK